MTLTPGARLGPYEVVAPLGAGGMGEVFRGRDTSLQRDVAIKVLPAAVAGDVDRLARFEREAQALAALNHPNIAHIYGLEKSGPTPAIVMEFVGGEDLSARITRGPVLLADALPLARQIADALSAAHEAGIIHRDLKPANIKVTDDGTVKVLDFGLAKALEPATAPGTSEAANSPTLTNRATQMGVILGTAAYMAPEQAKGKAVDRRADVWAFGVVLFEMLAGTRPFGGDDVTEVLAAVVRADPDWTALPKDTPPLIRRLLQRCLTKDVKQRLHDIADARLEIEDTIGFGADGSAAAYIGAPDTPTGRHYRGRVVGAVGWAVAGAIVTLVVGSAVQMANPATPARVIRYTLVLPDSGPLLDDVTGSPIAVSPDGALIAYVGGARPGRLYLRREDDLEIREIPGTNGARHPSFSPDGQSIAFIRQGSLQVISVAGGPPTSLSDSVSGFSWETPDQIVASSSAGAALWRLEVHGSGRAQIAAPQPQSKEGYYTPCTLPSGSSVLFAIRSGGPGAVDTDELAVVTRDGNVVRLGVAGSDPRCVDGLVLFSRADGSLWAATYDSAANHLGPEVALLDGVLRNGGYLAFGLSASGTLVYVPGIRGSRLARVDTSGKTEILHPDVRRFFQPRLSPDGRRLAVTIGGVAVGDVWLLDVASGALTPVTRGQINDRPHWNASGTRLAWRMIDRRRSLEPRILWQNWDGSDQPVTLVTNANDIAFSGAGFAFYTARPIQSSDVFRIELDSTRHITPFLTSPANEGGLAVSPDSRWLAFTSDKTGRTEVYVRPVDGAQEYNVSAGPGGQAQWAPAGNTVFYASGGEVYAASFVTVPEFGVVRRERVLSLVGTTGAFTTRDGRDFYVLQPVDPVSPDPPIVVVNWLREVRKRLVQRTPQ